MTTKTRVPYGRALGVANLLTAMLEPFCERIEIAGSIRRGRPDIGDVELVAVPRYYTRASTRDMFDAERMDEQVSQLKEALIIHLAEGRFHNRGAFGDRNIYLVHVDSDMAVDIFITDADNWGMMQFVRTGPADYVRRAMARFQLRLFITYTEAAPPGEPSERRRVILITSLVPYLSQRRVYPCLRRRNLRDSSDGPLSHCDAAPSGIASKE